MALHGDPGRLRQVIFNLLGNAIKFTPSGEVVLRVMVEQVHPTYVNLRFEVNDTGIGIAPDAQQKIFEAFCQADDSVTRNFGGTGLGLSIVRQLVEKMGGQVGLTSESGIGSTFYFTVCLDRQKERGAVPVQLSIAGQRILAVDDNRSVCRMLGGRLAARGFSVEMAPSAEEAISLLMEGTAAGRPFAAIFLDAGMPDDGCGRIVGLLTEPPFAGTRLVVMASREGVPSWAVSNGSTCIYKPLMPSQVDEGIASIPTRPVASGPGDICPAPGSERAGSGRGRILVAEDNPTTQNLLKISLGSLGHEVMIADNGRSALEMWRNMSFDLVLMDFHMPEMDGCTVTREMRSAGCDLPIIGLTAHSSTEYVEQCRLAGMDDYLSKPFKQKHLHQLVERWLTAGRTAGTNGGCSS
jgi:CheY-like chemotaxis protein